MRSYKSFGMPAKLPIPKSEQILLKAFVKVIKNVPRGTKKGSAK